MTKDGVLIVSVRRHLRRNSICMFCFVHFNIVFDSFDYVLVMFLLLLCV